MKKTMYFWINELEASLSTNDIWLLMKRNAMESDCLTPLRVESNNSVVIGFIANEIFNRSDFREEVLTARILEIMNEEHPYNREFSFMEDVSLYMVSDAKSLRPVQDSTYKLYYNLLRNTGDLPEFIAAPVAESILCQLKEKNIEINLPQCRLGGKFFSLTEDAKYAAYRELNLRYLTEDAKGNLILQIFPECSGGSSLDLYNKTCDQNTIDQFNQAAAEYGITYEDIDDHAYVVAERFVDDHDCNIADNDQMESIVRDYLDEIKAVKSI